MKFKVFEFNLRIAIMILSSCLNHVVVKGSEQMSIHDRMYLTIDSTAACFRVMNGTHSFGCSSSLNGNVGVIHLIESPADLTWLVNGTGKGPYVVALRPPMFRQSTLSQLIGNEKISGMLLMSAPSDPRVSSFSHADSCPNRYSSLPGSCDPEAPWNENGTALLLQDWGFPMFFIEDEEAINNITQCFKNFNLPLDETQNDRALCALELSSHMFSAVNSRVCTRRNELMSLSSSFSPIKYCDPIGGKNIYFPVPPLRSPSETANESVIIVAARMDAASLFYGSAPGALSAVTGTVTALSTAKLLWTLYQSAPVETNETVLFLLLNGETYDYIGSTRVVYDMKQKMFPNPTKYLSTKNIKLFIELSQLMSPKQLYYHYRNASNPEVVENFIQKLSKSVQTVNFLPVDGSLRLPPASFQTFLKEDPNIPGFILTNDYKKFNNRYYESIYDDAQNLGYEYSNGTKGILPGSVQFLLANLSTSLARALYETIFKQAAPDNATVTPKQVDELLYCYLENQNCSLWRSFAWDAKLDAKPASLYVGVDRHTNVATTFTALTLADFTANKTTIPFEQCSTDTNTSLDWSYIWMYGDATSGRCIKTYVKLTSASSPAFEIPDYKWDSGEFPTWTESVWSEFSMRMFLKPSRSYEIFSLSLGVTVIILSLFLVQRVNHCAGSIFNSTPSSPGS
ncbi:unnamed protein product [Bemisia tabaci]|uniref:Nicastrin n=2 Tax=Bemisia tabaci TaxID=7038 RepID=A0A9P0AML3_BEMTA|nr:unnamed protein product [Bemisia tabaci]